MEGDIAPFLIVERTCLLGFEILGILSRLKVALTPGCVWGGSSDIFSQPNRVNIESLFKLESLYLHKNIKICNLEIEQSIK